jgi:hypothetical protein
LCNFSSQGIDSIEGDISLAESLPFFTTPISLLPFHVVYKMGLDRGCFYQFVCFLRLFSLYQDGRIQINWEQRNTTHEEHTGEWQRLNVAYTRYTFSIRNTTYEEGEWQ